MIRGTVSAEEDRDVTNAGPDDPASRFGFNIPSSTLFT